MNGEFMPKDNDFQLLEVVRPHAQGGDLQKPTQHHVAERDKHDPRNVPSIKPNSRIDVPCIRPHDSNNWESRQVVDVDRCARPDLSPSFALSISSLPMLW